MATSNVTHNQLTRPPLIGNLVELRRIDRQKVTDAIQKSLDLLGTPTERVGKVKIATNEGELRYFAQDTSAKVLYAVVNHPLCSDKILSFVGEKIALTRAHTQDPITITAINEIAQAIYKHKRVEPATKTELRLDLTKAAKAAEEGIAFVLEYHTGLLRSQTVQ